MRILSTLAPVALASSVTPVQKVVEMLQGLHSKGGQEMAEEKKVFDEIEATVHKRLIDAGIEIEQNTDRVNKWSATVLMHDGEASRLTNEVADRQAANVGHNKELEAKTAFRKEEKSLYQTELTDLSESEDALTRAIGVLQTEQSKGPISASLVQQIAVAVPAAKADLEAFLAQPQATQTARQFQSGGIVTMLKDLLKEFKEKLHETRTEEMNKESAYQTWKTDQEYRIKGIEEEISDKVKEAGEHRDKEGAAAKKRDSAQEALAAAKKLKSETEIYSKLQTKSFTINQETRRSELVALAEAIKIMSSEDVSGASDKHMPGGESFIQVSSSSRNFLSNTDKSKLLARAQALIQRRTSDMKVKYQDTKSSKYLAMISAQLMTGGTFDKVINMVENLIAKLEEEAGAELEHKQWCDNELKLTGEDKDKKTAEVETKTAEKEGLEADKASNDGEIKRLNQELKELAKAVSKTTSERNEQNKINEETIADSSGAALACTKAITVLEEFYSKSSGSALLQTSQKQDPTIASYGGMTDSSTGVVGLIETIASDFTQLQSDTEANEVAAKAEYDAFMKISKKAKKEKEENVHALNLENVSLAAKIRRVAKALGIAQKQLDSIHKYSTELQPMCVIKHVSYEDRVAQRKEEIQALKDAYAVLSEQSGDV